MRVFVIAFIQYAFGLNTLTNIGYIFIQLCTVVIVGLDLITRRVLSVYYYKWHSTNNW